MSKVRRSVTLPSDTKADLERIKTETGAQTDNAAINEAVKFLAQFSNRRSEEIVTALRVYDQIRPAISGGDSIFLENPDTPNLRTRLVFT